MGRARQRLLGAGAGGGSPGASLHHLSKRGTGMLRWTGTAGNPRAQGLGCAGNDLGITGDPGQVTKTIVCALSLGRFGVLRGLSRVCLWPHQPEPILVPRASSLQGADGGTNTGHGHGALSRAPCVSSVADFNVLSFPPKAADTPADDGFRAPNASLQAAASQLQGQWDSVGWPGHPQPLWVPKSYPETLLEQLSSPEHPHWCQAGLAVLLGCLQQDEGKGKWGFFAIPQPRVGSRSRADLPQQICPHNPLSPELCAELVALGLSPSCPRGAGWPCPLWCCHSPSPSAV